MLVKEFMTTKLTTCHADQTVKDAADLMTKNGISILPIVDDESRLLGIVTESDFIGKEVRVPHAMASLKQLFGETFHNQDIESVYRAARDTKLEKVMSKNVKTVSKESTLTSVIDTMVANHLKRLPVIEDGKLIGIITRKDLMKAFQLLNND